MPAGLISPFDSARSVFAVFADTGSDFASDEDVVVVRDYIDIVHDTGKVETQLEDGVNIAGNSSSRTRVNRKA